MFSNQKRILPPLNRTFTSIGSFNFPLKENLLFIIIVESKYSSTPDRKIIELKDKNLGVDKEGNFQLSNNWIDFNIKKMKDSGIPEYEQVADILEKNKNNIRKEYYLVHGNKKISGNTFNDDLVKKNLDTTISGKHYTKDQTPGVDRVNIIELGYEVFENDIK